MAEKIPFELPPTADVVFQYLFSSPFSIYFRRLVRKMV